MWAGGLWLPCFMFLSVVPRRRPFIVSAAANQASSLSGASRTSLKAPGQRPHHQNIWWHHPQGSGLTPAWPIVPSHLPPLSVHHAATCSGGPQHPGMLSVFPRQGLCLCHSLSSDGFLLSPTLSHLCPWTGC